MTSSTHMSVNPKEAACDEVEHALVGEDEEWLDKAPEAKKVDEDKH